MNIRTLLAYGVVYFAFHFASSRALAWDSPGHMAVAGLAYDELSDAKKAKLVSLLQHHPALNLITEGFPSGSPADRDLVMAAATWPDLAKRSSAFHDNGYEAHDPAISAVTFDHLMHKGWHFIDNPLWVGNGPAPALPPAPAVNVVDVIKVLVGQLHSAAPDEAKAYDLGWLLHLVGDLHQPLHAATGISETYTNGDEGGNFVTLKGETRGEHELHAFWDDILGKTAKPDRMTKLPRLDKDVTTANNIISTLQAVPLGPDPDNIDPSVWSTESFHLAEQDVYVITLDVIPGERKDSLQATLDVGYGDTAVQDAKGRIRLAGHRLALVLKAIL